MSQHSTIEWTDATWNPIVGCSIVSPGCTNCYAMSMAARIEKMQPGSHYAGTTKTVNGNHVWTGKLALAPDHILTAPLRRKKPRRIFVNSMGDLFHESVPEHWIDLVFAIMALSPQHTFQCLTKRSKHMREYMTGGWQSRIGAIMDEIKPVEIGKWGFVAEHLDNCWLGVSAEDQARADERVPDLLDTPAAVRFVSYEPALGPLTLGSFKPDWVIMGSESGRNARPARVEWFQSMRDQCLAAGIPFFLKQFVDDNGHKIHTPELDGQKWLQFPQITA